LAFDGTSDYVDCGGISIDENVSLSAWIKTDDSSFEIITANVAVSETAGVRLTKYNNGQIGILVSDGISYLQCTADGNIADGNWHFIVATVDTAVAKIYVDGEYKNEVDISGQGSHISSDTFYIGRRPGGSPSYFTGLIDGVRIYNKALSGDEITDLYDEGGI